MNTRISLYAMGHALSLLIAISFTLCFVFDLIFPQYAMYSTWQALLPGFTALNLTSFFIGVVEAYAYGWFFALIGVPLYNFFLTRTESS